MMSSSSPPFAVSCLSFLLLLIFAEEKRLFARSASTEECLDTARSILERNSPEFVLIPDEGGYNTFITTSVKVNVDWSHLATILDESCIGSYLLEYRQFDYYGEKTINARLAKRETSANDARISPPIPTDKTSYVISLPDDCKVYAVNLVVVPRAGAGGHLLYSKTRRFWPAAHRTSVESFSDALVLSWPPICTHMTQEWRLETCASAQDDCDVQTLMGDSPIHISGLRSCNAYTLRLLASTDDSGGVSGGGGGGAGDVLWAFNQVHTLPKPQFDLKAGHETLSLQISQAGCVPSAKVDHWRITHCQHVPSSKQKTLYGNDNKGEYTLDLEEEKEEGDGSGAADQNDDDADEYYYYDQDDEVNSCINTQHDVSESGEIVLEHLEKCTLYSIDITPTDRHGETLQPGEQYGTIHSTLCGGGDQKTDQRRQLLVQRRSR